MNIEIFELERIQSLYENYVDYNLTESGVHPYTMRELLQEKECEAVLDLRLTYGQTNGTEGLRDAISALYRAADRDNVLVTNGSSEANLVSVLTCLEPGDEVAVMLPNYMQIWGLARAIGVNATPFHLREDRNWAPDLDELERVIVDKTKMIIVCNPNNPTGAVLSEEDMGHIVRLAEGKGAWIYTDEVYRGAELDEVETPSFQGMYERVMVACGLSKAYALPGLRLGWLVGPQEIIEQAWATHDYTSVAAGVVSNLIATAVLQPELRAKILKRNRSMLRENLVVFREWLDSHGELFSFIPPKAGGMAFVRYGLDINSRELCNRLRQEKSVFVVAGDCYGMDRYIRIGIGSEKGHFLTGLNLINELLSELTQKPV